MLTLVTIIVGAILVGVWVAVTKRSMHFQGQANITTVAATQPHPTTITVAPAKQTLVPGN